MKELWIVTATLLIFGMTGCKPRQPDQINSFTGAAGEVKLITLDPGHFHAALVQKTMYPQVNPVVHVYAPDQQDVIDHLARIEAYNSRETDPCTWEEKVYTGDDFLERMLAERNGNVVVLAGNNARKTDYILASVKSGLNVLADKPMAITPEGFSDLEEAFRIAGEKGVLLYDIMTERFEITTLLQRELACSPEVFGQLLPGTAAEPAITKESVHHFKKMVSGASLKRPGWFFDTTRQGEGIVDVTTHLVDLIQWEAFPEVILAKEDVEMVSARRWSTSLTADMFRQVTGMEEYPDYLKKDVEDGLLEVFSNGEMVYRLKGIYARVSVNWDFEAPEGAGDTHYSIMRGSRCNVIIRQGREENFIPTLYVEVAAGEPVEAFESLLIRKVTSDLAGEYPGLGLTRQDEKRWKMEIPGNYRVGHETHFGQVTAKYLDFLVEGALPAWEVPNMIVKYHTLMEALMLARAGD